MLDVVCCQEDNCLGDFLSCCRTTGRRLGSQFLKAHGADMTLHEIAGPIRLVALHRLNGKRGIRRPAAKGSDSFKR